MLRLDINLVFTIINLLIWYAIIRIFLFKPINKVIDKRNAAIQEKYDEAKKMQEEAQAEKEKYAACQDEIEVEKCDYFYKYKKYSEIIGCDDCIRREDVYGYDG